MVSPSADGAACVVIGDGLIGLSTALELSRHTTVLVIGGPHEGMASTAAAGLLIPTLDRLPNAARPFFADSLDRFPAFIDTLRRFDPHLRLIAGMLDRSGGAEVVRERDGAVDNVRLLGALRAAVEASPNAAIREDFVLRLEPRQGGLALETKLGHRILAERVVLAAGAWSSAIAGLPRMLPVRPLKGQMIALRNTQHTRAVMS